MKGTANYSFITLLFVKNDFERVIVRFVFLIDSQYFQQFHFFAA